MGIKQAQQRNVNGTMVINFHTIIARYSGNKTFVAGITLAAIFIVITPLCGVMFQCGCTWPGLGLDAGCNIHDIKAQHQCPWCASPLTGWLSAGFAASIGIIASIFPPSWITRQKSFAPMWQILLGISIFVTAALITGGISAFLQHYPLRLSGLIN